MTQFSLLMRPLLVLALLLSAPFSLAAPKMPPAAKPALGRNSVVSVQVTGQVFVVTQGHESVKLALVTIGQISESDLASVNGLWKESVEKRRLAIRQQLADVSQQLRDTEHGLDDLKEERRRASEKSIECAMTIATTDPRYQDKFAECSARPEIKEAQERAVSLHARIYDGQIDKRIKGLRSRLAVLLEEFDNASDQVVPLDAYSGRVTAVAKSDADGRFAFSYRPDQHLVLFAQSSRYVGSASEHYRWLVRLPSSETSQSVQMMLANDNMDVSGCPSCVQHVVTLDPYPDVELVRRQVLGKTL